ncbi:MAG: transcription termination/antitermination protein NusA [Azospirillum brasilense]|nr:MAG: transcription termination/antitermination protein NusA [Azospirillum brasilense]
MAVPQVIHGSTEMLQIADAVAREKNIERDQVLEAMENAIQIAGRKKYGAEHDIRAVIDRKTGAISLHRVITVVEEVDPELVAQQITLADAQKKYKNRSDLELGSEIRDELPPIDFGRVAAQTAKQVIVQKVRDFERDHQFEEFKDRVGEIVNGVVKRVEYGNVTVDFGRAEAVIRKDELIPRETFRPGDRIRAYIFDVRREKNGPQVFLSRTRPEFMAKLFMQEVPEIYDGIIEIKAVARDPGSRAKIAVLSNDFSVNPVLSCVGVRGSRVQAVVGELQGEKVDIVQYAEDPATFVVNALSSAEVSKVVIDEDSGRIEVVVPDDQLSLAIGRRGQNVRLAAQLTGWSIDILTEETESERRTQEFNRLSELFVEALNVEEVIAHLLVTEGFSSVEEVAYVPVEDLASIEGFDESVAEELRNRAQEYLDTKEAETTRKLKELGVEEAFMKLEGLNLEIVEKLANEGIKSIDDFAGLATDEFFEIVPKSGLGRDEVEAMIMKHREAWF